MGIQDLSDDQLKNLYSQQTSAAPDISKLSDDDLKAMYAKSIPQDTSFGHYAGITGRAIAEGLPSITDLPARAQKLVEAGLNYPASYIASGISHLKGQNISPEQMRQILPMIESKMPGHFVAPTDYISKGLDAIGVPNPNPGPETIAFDTGKALAGVAGSYGLGASGAVGKSIGKFLTQRPVNQALAAGLGAASGSAAKEAGFGPGVQLAASLVGGIGAPMAMSGAGTVAGGMYDAGKALMTKPETYAGQALRYAAQESGENPDTVLQTMQNSPEYIPGSPQTAGEASGNRGIIGLQKSMRNSGNMAPFGEVESAQNAARNDFMNSFIGSDADLEAAKEMRDSVTSPMRTAAFENAQPVSLEDALAKIQQVRQSPSGAQEAVEHGLNWAQGRINKLQPLTENTEVTSEGQFGEPITKTESKVLGYDPESVYSVRKDIAAAARGDYTQSDPLLRHAGSQLRSVQGDIDSAIEAAAPGYKDYMSEYARQSKGIDQMQSLIDLRNRVVDNKMIDPTTKLPTIQPQAYVN